MKKIKVINSSPQYLEDELQKKITEMEKSDYNLLTISPTSTIFSTHQKQQLIVILVFEKQV